MSEEVFLIINDDSTMKGYYPTLEEAEKYIAEQNLDIHDEGETYKIFKLVRAFKVKKTMELVNDD